MKTMLAMAMAAAAVLSGVATANLGLDVAGPFDQSTFSCLVNAGLDFVAVRAWHSYGGFDSDAPDTIRAAQAAGMKVGVYIFPCATQDGASQVSSALSQLSDAGINTGSLNVWMDIETNPSSGCGWPSDENANCNYIAEMVQAANAAGARGGVYSSSYMWDQIPGSSCTSASSAPLWYAGYTYEASCSDWRSFGGWSSPTIHQYSDRESQCGITYDADITC